MATSQHAPGAAHGSCPTSAGVRACPVACVAVGAGALLKGAAKSVKKRDVSFSFVLLQLSGDA